MGELPEEKDIATRNKQKRHKSETGNDRWKTRRVETENRERRREIQT